MNLEQVVKSGDDARTLGFKKKIRDYHNGVRNKILATGLFISGMVGGYAGLAKAQDYKGTSNESYALRTERPEWMNEDIAEDGLISNPFQEWASKTGATYTGQNADGVSSYRLSSPLPEWVLERMDGRNRDLRSVTINVDPSWTYQEVNNILDGNVLTVGKNGEADAVSGDVVHFDAGTYQLPMVVGASFKNYISGVTIEGEGEDTVFRGGSPSSSVIWVNQAGGVTFQNFRTENSYVGIQIKNTVDYSDSLIEGVTTSGHGTHVDYERQQAGSSIYTPSIWIVNHTFDGGSLGVHFSRDGPISSVSLGTKYVGFFECTADGLANLVIDAPAVWSGGQVMDIRVEAYGVNITNSNASFSESYYEGTAFRGGDGGVSPVRTFGIVEAGVGSTPLSSIDPSNRYFDNSSLLMVNSETGAPMYGSPLVARPTEITRTLDFGGELVQVQIPLYDNGFVGATEPVRFNSNGDGAINLSDLSGVNFTGPAVSMEFGNLFDYDYDGDTDLKDFAHYQTLLSSN